MKRKDKLFIEVLTMASGYLDGLTEEEIQRDFGSDYYQELKRFISWGAMAEWRGKK